MRSSRKVRLSLLLLVLSLWPALALAQQPSKAGVVTALRGQATVARIALPQPALLHFKDDVFFQDRVATERDSIVKVLLGGKALVTIRELSDFSIVEGPNKSTVNLNLGRLAFQVLRRLMRPGEEFEVRTPNAIAAVRGTWGHAHVREQAGQYTSTFTAFTPGVLVTNLATGITEILNVNQQKSVVGAQSLPTVNLPPEQAKQLRQQETEAPKEKGHTDKPPASLAAKVSGDKAQEATLLAAVLTGGAGAPVAGDPFLVAPTGGLMMTPSTSSLCVQCPTITTIATRKTPPPPHRNTLH